MPFSVRAAVPSDLEAIVFIDQRSFAIPWSRQSFAYELEKNPYAYYLLLLDEAGEPAGYAAFHAVVDEAEIMNIGVLPEARGEGGGSLLLGSLIQEAERRGLLRMILEVREHNAPAQALYRKFGFTRCGLRRRYYADTGEDAFIMERLLSAAGES